MLPSPTDVVTAFVEDFPALMTHARVSLSEAFLGLVTAVILSFVVAFLMDQFRVVREAVYPLLILTQTVPTVAIAPRCWYSGWAMESCPRWYSLSSPASSP